MKAFIRKNISGKKVLILFILTNIIYCIMLFITIPRVIEFSNSMKIFDMMPMGYSYEYAIQLLKTLGEQGRQAYLFQQLPMDVIYPFFFGLSNCLILAYFLNKINQLESIFFNCCYIPIVAGIFDYTENLGIFLMLKSFPELSESLVEFSNYATIFKSILTTLFFIILLIVLAIFGYKKANGRA